MLHYSHLSSGAETMGQLTSTSLSKPRDAVLPYPKNKKIKVSMITAEFYYANM
jgi:hypothetical protein